MGAEVERGIKVGEIFKVYGKGYDGYETDYRCREAELEAAWCFWWGDGNRKEDTARDGEGFEVMYKERGLKIVLRRLRVRHGYKTIKKFGKLLKKWSAGLRTGENPKQVYNYINVKVRTSRPLFGSSSNDCLGSSYVSSPASVFLKYLSSTSVEHLTISHPLGSSPILRSL